MKNQSWHLKKFPQGLPTQEDWELKESDVPKPRPGEILVETQWLSVDPYMRGRISSAKNYARGITPGDIMVGGGIGKVIESQDPSIKEGDIVSGDTFGWQNYTTMTAGNVRKLNPDSAPVQSSLSYLGMPGLTAYFALLHTAAPKEGETILISAASGAVGQIAGQICKIKGYNPVAVCGTDEKLAWCQDMGYSAGINHRHSQNLVEDVRQACPNGVDVYIDNTAGPIHDAAMLNLNTFGRVVVVGTIALADRFGEDDIGLRHLRQTLITRARIQGFLLDDFKDHYDQAITELTDWYHSGLLKPREDTVQGLDQAPHAFVRMLKGENFGKQLVKI